jgi:hypothetical protein
MKSKTNWADEVSSDEELIVESRINLASASTASVPSYIVYLGDISPAVSYDALRSYLEKNGCKVTKLDFDKFNPTTAEFSDEISYRNCLNLDGKLLLNQKLICRNKNIVERQDRRNDYDRRKPLPSKDNRDQKKLDSGDNRFPIKPNQSFQTSNYPKNAPHIQNRSNQLNQPVKSNIPETKLEDTKTPATRAERPKIIIQPRTLPIDNIGEKVSTKTNIFGEGKPQDVSTYEVSFYF